MSEINEMGESLNDYLHEFLGRLIETTEKSLKLWSNGQFIAKKNMLSLFPSHFLGLAIVVSYQMKLPKDQGIAFLALARSIYLYEKAGKLSLFFSSKKRSDLVPYKLIIDFVGDYPTEKKELCAKFFEQFLIKTNLPNGDADVDKIISKVTSIF